MRAHSIQEEEERSQHLSRLEMLSFAIRRENKHMCTEFPARVSQKEVHRQQQQSHKGKKLTAKDKKKKSRNNSKTLGNLHLFLSKDFFFHHIWFSNSICLHFYWQTQADTSGVTSYWLGNHTFYTSTSTQQKQILFIGIKTENNVGRG